MGRTFTKTYPEPGRARAAAEHHRWLGSLGAPVPELLEAAPDHLVFAHAEGEHCHVIEIPAVSAQLGSLHAEAFVRELHAADLNIPFPTASGVLLPGFTESRISWLSRRRQNGLISQERYEVATAVTLRASEGPAAFYKDSNIRNVLIGRRPVLVDFDDLTLAPFGYDLAKLLVSAAMTYGPLPNSTYRQALEAYQKAVQVREGPSMSCTWEDFNDWLELHALLTGDYLGRNGYRYSWRSLRPWRRTSPKDVERR
ncbi:phosphotransferase [Nocardiopsis alba]